MPDGEEVVGERTAVSRTFTTSVPGVLVSQVSSGPMNFRSDGSWHVIDPSLVSDGDGGFHNAADSVDLELAGSADAPVLGDVSLSDGSSVGFGLDDASDSAPTIASDTATYENVKPGVDLQLQSLPSGLKETLILESAGSPHHFTFPLHLEELTGAVESDGSVSFRDVDGSIRLIIPPGSMQDSSHADASGQGVSSDGVEYSLGSGGTELEVSLDHGWLNDPERVYPVQVDPTLSVWSESDDTYVTDGVTADNSSGYLLKVGYDGTHVNRSFMHFDLSDLDGMDVLAADLAFVQNGSGSCASSPMDVYQVTTSWSGSTTTSWPGPSVAAQPTATVWSGLGHDGSCPYGWATSDLTRTAQQWVVGDVPNNGISLRARDEGNAGQFKQEGSSESYVPPTINILWTEPGLTSAPDDPDGLAPPDLVTTDPTPELSADYSDPQTDDGMVVFFAYDSGNGAFFGGFPSAVVDSGARAAYTSSSPLPLDYPILWRALAVDTVHSVPSNLTEEHAVLRPSVYLTIPAEEDEVSGSVTLAASLDASVTSVTSIQFLIDGSVVGTDTSAPYSVTWNSGSVDDGSHVVLARIVGGGSDQIASPAVDAYVSNDEHDEEYGEWEEISNDADDFEAAVPEGFSASPESTPSCSGQVASHIVRKYKNKYGTYINLRCGTSGYGFNHISSRWTSNFEWYISHTLSGANTLSWNREDQGGGTWVYNAHFPAIPGQICFRVVVSMNKYADGKNKGIITAYYRTT